MDDVDIIAMRFADGSRTNIPLPALDSPWTRWLMTKRVAPAIESLAQGDVHDILGRPVLPAPPFRLGWIALATVAAGIVTLLSALP
jgi:hypothetical protein